MKQQFTNVNIAAQNLMMSMRRIVMNGCVDIQMLGNRIVAVLNFIEDGTEIKFDDAAFVWADFDDVEAFIIGNESDVKFVKDFFEWNGYDNPFRTIEDETNPNYYGLWWFDPAMRYYGEWVRVDDQIKKWTDIKNKFMKDG